ncbi:MAG TPA: hypothetical protein VNP98_17400 [Chthoniobacterales bacterium]|nr:hypothetical protein [Chthoniobacterales bacterium]
MSTLFARTHAIVPIIAAASLLGKEGYFYKLNGSNQAILCAAVTDVPHGLIAAVSKDGLEISAAPLGGNHGTMKVKLGADVTDLRLDLTLRADATAESNDNAGNRVVVARPLEVGVADEEIEAVLLYPRLVGNAVTIGNANGAIGALNSTAVNPTKADFDALLAATEVLADDVRAIYAALQANGTLG